MGLWTFNPKDLNVMLGVLRIEGWADGSFLTIAYNSDQVSLTVGADGFATRVISPDMSAKITFRLQPAAPANIGLNALQTADRATGKGVPPLAITLRTTTPPCSFLSPGAWIVKDPGQQFSKGAVDFKEWILETHELLPIHGAENASIPLLGV
jgi:hypothetical protein